jgi:hypothetical protein
MLTIASSLNEITYMENDAIVNNKNELKISIN